MILLSLIGLLLLGASVALVARALALPRLRTSDQIRAIENYGFEAPAPTAAGRPEQPVLSNLADQLGRLLARRLRGVRPEGLRRELMAAGLYRVSPTQLLGYRVLGLIVLGLLGLGAGRGASPFAALVIFVVAAGLGWLGPLILVRRRARFRLEEIDRSLPDMIDLMVVTVESGMGLGGSLQLAATRLEGALGDEVRLAMQEQRMGRSLTDALQGMLNRADTPGMRSFVRSITQGESLGVSIGSIMRTLAVEMRKRRKQQAEERAQKAPVKMLLPLAFFIFPALGIVVLGPALYSIGASLGS